MTVLVSTMLPSARSVRLPGVAALVMMLAPSAVMSPCSTPPLTPPV